MVVSRREGGGRGRKRARLVGSVCSIPGGAQGSAPLSWSECEYVCAGRLITDIRRDMGRDVEWAEERKQKVFFSLFRLPPDFGAVKTHFKKGGKIQVVPGSLSHGERKHTHTEHTFCTLYVARFCGTQFSLDIFSLRTFFVPRALLSLSPEISVNGFTLSFCRRVGGQTVQPHSFLLLLLDPPTSSCHMFPFPFFPPFPPAIVGQRPNKTAIPRTEKREEGREGGRDTVGILKGILGKERKEKEKGTARSVPLSGEESVRKKLMSLSFAPLSQGSIPPR